MRRAFYMGCACLLNLMSNEFDPGTEPTDLDNQYMESLNADVLQFFNDMAEGKN